MILCIGPNPALDRTLVVGELRPGAVHRAEKVIVQAGGKAANVARVLTALGHDATLIGPLGGANGGEVRRLATEEGLLCSWAEVEQPTRVCTAVVGGPHQVTDFNESGYVGRPGWDRFVQVVVASSELADLILLSGSVPETDATDAVTSLVRALRRGTPIWADTSSVPLLDTASAIGSLGLVKVNAVEASAILGDVETPDATAENGAELASRVSLRFGCAAIVTLGSNGAVWTDGNRVLSGALEVQNVINPTGSGDAFFAGFAASTQQHPDQIERALRLAMACGASNAQQLTAGQIDTADLPDLRVTATLGSDPSVA